MLARLVLDTNIVLSASLRIGSTTHLAFLKARTEAELLASEQTLAELQEVLLRPKFDRFVDRAIRELLFREYSRICNVIPASAPIRACRDPRDDKFLELAVAGHADAILTGDADLLVLHSFRGIAILAPYQYLELT